MDIVGTYKDITIFKVDIHYSWVIAGHNPADKRRVDTECRDGQIGFVIDEEWVPFDDVDVIYKEDY